MVLLRNNCIVDTIRKKRLGESPPRTSWKSTKCKAWLSLDLFKIIFYLCFFFDRYQKGAHFYQRGVTQQGSTAVCGE